MSQDISTADTVSDLVRLLIEDYPDNEAAKIAIAQTILNERQDLINECVCAHIGFLVSKYHNAALTHAKKKKVKSDDDIMDREVVLGGGMLRSLLAHATTRNLHDTMINGVCLGDVVAAAEKRADPSSHSAEHLSKPDTQKTAQRRKRKR